MTDRYKILEIVNVDDLEDEYLVARIIDALLELIQTGKERLCVLICEEPVKRFNGGAK